MSWHLEQGDCREVLKQWAVDGVLFDSCVTDPPYDLTSIVKRFGKAGAAPAKSNGATGVYKRASSGFMGQTWDGTGVAFDPETWRAVYDVLKPGAHLVAFGGTRTSHRMTCAIEDAGFEIRDSLCWLYGTGFPKNHDVSKGIDKLLGKTRTEVIGSKLGRPGMAKDGSNQRSGFDDAFGGDASGSMSSDILAPASPEAEQWAGWGTALKPAYEPIILARKPLEGTVAGNVLAWGVGGINIDGCRVPTSDKLSGGDANPDSIGSFTNDGWRSAWMDDPDARAAHAAKIRNNVEKAETLGRWPANLIHDGSPEVLEAFEEFGPAPGQLARAKTDGAPKNNAIYGAMNHGTTNPEPRDDGPDITAARYFPCCPWSEDELRFFYSAKANKKDRAGSNHPTVKPISLMKWLTRLVTPPGGLILEPFAGSGSTIQAAVEQGFDCMAIEQSADYCVDIHNRMKAFANV